MKKYLLFLLFLTVGIMVEAKTTYIPKYQSYIHIVNGLDTMAVSNILENLELAEEGGMFTIRIEHEEVTKEKVKAIKRAKRAAGWMEFSAVMSGVSTAFSNNSLQYMVRSTNTQVAIELTDFYKANANAEQKLNIDMWIDNTSGAELLVNDMERGLVWYVQPSQSLHIKMNNPDVSNLRISDIHNNNVRFVIAMAGSKVKKWEIDYETDEFWFSPVYKPQQPHDSFNLLHYIRISKNDYEYNEMSVQNFKEFKKTNKNK